MEDVVTVWTTFSTWLSANNQWLHEPFRALIMHEATPGTPVGILFNIFRCSHRNVPWWVELHKARRRIKLAVNILLLGEEDVEENVESAILVEVPNIPNLNIPSAKIGAVVTLGW